MLMRLENLLNIWDLVDNMGLIENIYGGLHNFAYLVKSKHSSRTKVLIMLTWFKINFKFLLFSKLFKLKTERIFGYKIDAFDYGAIRFLFEEIFYRNEYFFITKNKKPIIFDCGANIGVATIFFKWIYPESEIYAFEPDKKTFEILRKNISQNGFKQVHLYNSAISNKNGKIDFFFDSNKPGSLIMSTKQGRMPKEKISVDCLSLSNIIKNISIIDYVKMDIEGSEDDVIKDLDKKSQLNKITKFSIEYHHKIKGHRSKLSEFLWIFEKNGFEYQIDTTCVPLNAEDKFQDVLLYIYR